MAHGITQCTSNIFGPPVLYVGEPVPHGGYFLVQSWESLHSETIFTLLFANQLMVDSVLAQTGELLKGMNPPYFGALAAPLSIQRLLSSQ